jgi:hypothetical protein
MDPQNSLDGQQKNVDFAGPPWSKNEESKKIIRPFIPIPDDAFDPW